MPDKKKLPLSAATEQEENKDNLSNLSVSDSGQNVKLPKNWTAEDEKQLRELAGSKLSTKQIARRMGKDESAVRERLKEKKSDPESWTEQADKDLERYLLCGYTLELISRKMGYSVELIQQHIPEARKRLSERYKGGPYGDLAQVKARKEDSVKTADRPEAVSKPVNPPGLLDPGEPIVHTFDTLKNAAMFNLGCDLAGWSADQDGVIFTLTLGARQYTLALEEEEVPWTVS